MDAHSVKNTVTAGLKGYDAGKKVSGIKRHIAADTQGLPHATAVAKAVTTAEVTDHEGALSALARSKPSVGRVKSLLCGSGHTGALLVQGVKDTLGGQVTVRIAKRSELHTFKASS